MTPESKAEGRTPNAVTNLLLLLFVLCVVIALRIDQLERAVKKRDAERDEALAIFGEGMLVQRTNLIRLYHVDQSNRFYFVFPGESSVTNNFPRGWMLPPLEPEFPSFGRPLREKAL
jgi:hypothetical protein